MPDDIIFNRVLLTNDDGIDAPGLAVLEAVAAELAQEVWVVAPGRDQSGTSHSLSMHSPLRLLDKGGRRFAVDGTPGDCVVLGVRHLMRDAPPDIVLSGVNRGSNVGRETVFSGTVGAAMTGLLLGIPSIALSQGFRRPDPVRWDTARTLAPGVIRTLAALMGPTGWGADACLNVNFPFCGPERAGGLTLARQGLGLLGGMDIASAVDPRGLPYYWLKPVRGEGIDLPGGEVAVMEAGGVSVTPLRFERTDEDCFERLRRALG